MTAPLRGTPRLSNLPASQNTAPVAEFRCLFTNDIRRKQKRWQDGYVKFHTFNNRVMAYDASRNLVGDTYWKESNALQEGDELTLDKGVMIQVEERMGVTQTDLTALFEKKSPAKPTALAPPPRPSVVVPSNNRSSLQSTPYRAGAGAASQLRHRSLNSLLGTPKGLIGKALPIKSPYEARQEKENGSAVQRPAKRIKTSNHAPATSSREESSPVTKRPVVPVDRTSVSSSPKVTPRKTVIIDITSDSPVHFPSDDLIVTPPTKACHEKRTVISRPIASSPIAPVGRTRDQPVEDRQRSTKLRREKAHRPRSPPRSIPQPSLESSSPPVCSSNHLTDLDQAIQVPEEETPQAQCQAQSPPRKPKTKSLRLAASTKRGLLMCQSARPPNSRASNILPRTSSKATERRDASSPNLLVVEHVYQPPSPISGTEQTKKAYSREESPRKRQRTTTATRLKGDESEGKSIKVAQSLPGSLSGFDDIEVVHGNLDLQIYPPKAHDPNDSFRQTSKLSQPSFGNHDTESGATDRNPSSDRGKKISTKKASTKRKVVSAESPEEAVDPGVLEPESRPKPIAPTTGGFRKKPKRTGSAAAVPPEEPSIPPQRTDIIQPRATNKLGLLQKQPNFPSIEDDPIEDDVRPNKIASPKRSMRRVRSENDAPIPSNSEEWEKNNLNLENGGNADPSLDGSVVDKTSKTASKRGLAALVKRTDPRRKFTRTRSLIVDTNVNRLQGGDDEIPSPPVDTDVGPWSTEAFDLFDWRPPQKEGDNGIGMLADK